MHFLFNDDNNSGLKWCYCLTNKSLEYYHIVVNIILFKRVNVYRHTFAMFAVWLTVVIVSYTHEYTLAHRHNRTLTP